MLITEVIIISLVASGMVAYIGRLIYSSKCKYVKCCGCEIHRDTDHETSVRNIQVPTLPGQT